MTGSPLVSVVIPTYSRPVYLKRCIESVLNQTYSNLEIFVVDDNNPDTEYRVETEKIMSGLASVPNIMYIQHDKNRNGSAARNTGWRKSKGKYITFLDDDDEIAPIKIYKQVECMEALDESWGACYTGYRLIKEHGQNQVSSENRFGNCYIDALMRTMFMGSGSNLLLRKSVVDEINGYDESFQRNQDIEFLVRVCEKYKLAYVNENLLTICQEGNRKRWTFEELDRYSQHYIEIFSERINNLPKDEKERVISVISLERCRVALMNHRIKAGFRILKENRVSYKYKLRYIKYLVRRKITSESYGFNGL